MIVTKFNDHYVELQTLRVKLDSMYGLPTGELVSKSFMPDAVILKDGIVLIKDRNHKPLYLVFYSDSVIVHENLFYKNTPFRQTFEGSKTDSFIGIQLNIEGGVYSLCITFKKQRLVVVYDDPKKPVVKITAE